MEPVITYYEGTNFVESKTWYNKDNQIHREDGPAYIKFSKEGKVILKEWRINGLLHNEKDPARIFLDGPMQLHWYREGKHHNENGPAIIIYYDNNISVCCEIWKRDDLTHRPTREGPAFIVYYPSEEEKGNVSEEHYYENGELYREEGNPKVYYNKDGSVFEQRLEEN